ncbi:CUE domain-containing protein 5 [Sphaceloma murrayae]|uniref:CUE domain-containing protein 5 n=1 Tax=Sphaceloma murrayae TaxID=2082308 RepID=A0A2K1QXF2_9PEZI|nr:CUE domain-containing protein 5 [Sphaceloma murrayae]
MPEQAQDKVSLKEEHITNKQLRQGSQAPESPTTARQLDFDDDEPQDSSASKSHQATVEDEDSTAPTKPPRPASPQQQAEHTLIEAFPSIDAKVVKAVLTASGGQVEPAFNALLGMSDPNFKEEAPPPQPPRPVRSQLEQDEMYARQLAQHYNSTERAQRDGSGQQRGQMPPRQTTQERLYAQDRERSFFDDDLPEIQKSIQKGFMETQTKVNSWFNNFKKKLEGDEDDPYDGPTRLDSPPGGRQNQQQSGYSAAHQGGSRTRRSGDYDADPRELGDDFTQLELRDEEVPPPKPSRPTANPDLFKSTPAPPQSGPVDEVDAVERRATSPNNGPAKKWQPLTSVAAQPEPEENDPFSVGDSDDDKDTKTKDVRETDTQRLKDAARKSISEGGDKSDKAEGGKLEKTETQGTKDKTAEELLAKK